MAHRSRTMKKTSKVTTSLNRRNQLCGTDTFEDFIVIGILRLYYNMKQTLYKLNGTNEFC